MEESSSRQNNYEWDCNPLEKFFLVNSALTAKRIRDISEVEKLTHDICPKITEDQNCVEAAERIKAEVQGEYSNEEIMGIIYRAFKKEIHFIFFLLAIEFFFDTLNLLSFQLLINVIWEKPEGWSQQLPWIVVVMGVAITLKTAVDGRITMQASALVMSVRGGMSMIVMEKILSMTGVMASRQNVGKICNILVTDFTMLIKIPFTFFESFALLFKLIVILGILYYRLGWVGLFLFIPTVLVFLYQVGVSRIFGTFMRDVNKEKDKRIELYNQMLEGIKVIKLYGWEYFFKDKIQAIREAESSQYFKLNTARCFQRSAQKAGPYFITLTTFLFILLIEGNDLSSFTIMAILQPNIFLATYVWTAGLGLNYYIMLTVAFERFCNVLSTPNYELHSLDGSKPNQDELQQGDIKFTNFSGYKNEIEDEENAPFLKGISFHLKKGGFYGVVGRVGSGKSALLKAIIGEVPFCKGTVAKKGSVAFVEQEPPMFVGTVRENILFGKQFETGKYDQIISLCCLKDDFEILQHGDQSIVGERGVTLSGGQKARVSLARALYSDSDIYLFDDPLSAVDPKVAKNLFDGIFQTLKNRKTSIFVTHHTHFLEASDRIIFIDKGEAKIVEKLSDITLSLASDQKKEPEPAKPNSSSGKQLPRVANKSARYEYFTFHPINFLLIPISIVFFFLFEFMIGLIFQYYGKLDEITEGTSQLFESQTQFWIVLIAFHFLVLFADLLRTSLTYLWMLKTNDKVHSKMIEAASRAPLGLFDEVGTGGFISRFSNDMGILDNFLSMNIINFLERIATWIVMLYNVVSINTLYLIALILCTVFLVWFVYWSIRAIVAIQELYLREKNKIFSNFLQTITGLTTIRTLNHSALSSHEFALTLNRAFKTENSYIQFNGFFGFFISLVSNFLFFTIFTVVAATITQDQAMPYLISMLFVLRVIACIQFLCSTVVDNEGLKVNIERIWDIIDLKTEAELFTEYDQEKQIDDEHHSLMEWPQEAKISFKNLSLKYRQNLPLVLNGVSLEIKDGDKIGIVGRTGAGKSSLVQALFRLVEPEKGSSYKIGGYDALKMGLHRLRTTMSIIPQTPFLFKGSIQENIDPFNTKSQKQIWNALRIAGLQSSVSQLPKKLDTMIESSAELFSSGQKQLLCLTRALVQKRKFLVLDQPTSLVDMETDHAVHQCIKEEFNHATIITIAHRISTIANYDKILVLDKGRIIEFGSPSQLIRQQGVFYQMIKNYEENSNAS